MLGFAGSLVEKWGQEAGEIDTAALHEPLDFDYSLIGDVQCRMQANAVRRRSVAVLRWWFG